MGRQSLGVAEGEFGPLLATDIVDELQGQYLSKLRKNVAEWMSNSATTDTRVSHE